MDKNVKEQERRYLNKKIIQKTAASEFKNSQKFLKKFTFNFIILFITFALSNFIVDIFSINSWFLKMFINIALVVILFLLVVNIINYIKKDRK